MVWDHEEAVRPVSGRSGLRLGFYRSAPRAHGTDTGRDHSDQDAPRRTDRSGESRTRTGQVPTAGGLLAGWVPAA